jgi:hypothetical protein
MKFALLELKVTLVEILKKFEIKKSTETTDEFKYVEGIVLSPIDEIYLIVEKREI